MLGAFVDELESKCMDACVLHHDVRSTVYICYVYSSGHNFCMGSTVAMNYKTVSIATYSSENLMVKTQVSK